MNYEEIISLLKAKANPVNVAGMARFGINPHNTLGISVTELRALARQIGKKQHLLAEQLWDSGIHEARILACLIDDPKQVDSEQMERWVRDFDSWDVCDQCCINLFRKTGFAYEKAAEWVEREEEFVKRAGFVLIATLAVNDKKAGNDVFEGFLQTIKEKSNDERNFVKKAVNWALRQIGKRNRYLNAAALKTAEEIAGQNNKAARWIARDAIRELSSEKIQAGLKD